MRSPRFNIRVTRADIKRPAQAVRGTTDHTYRKGCSGFDLPPVSPGRTYAWPSGRESGRDVDAEQFAEPGDVLVERPGPAEFDPLFVGHRDPAGGDLRSTPADGVAELRVVGLD